MFYGPIISKDLKMQYWNLQEKKRIAINNFCDYFSMTLNIILSEVL